MRPAVVFDCVWGRPLVNLVLPEDEVHLWRADLDQPAPQVERLAQTLAPDEQIRADRFHFERDRQYYIVGRGVLRTILGWYLKREPGELHFNYGPRGKPALPDILNQGRICFNLAHSQGLALYGLARGRDIGVDLEYIRPVSDMGEIARRFFSAQENAALLALPPDQRQEAFFNCWTRKEAYLKATGDGLAQPLDQFDVSLGPEEPARLLRITGQSHLAARWSMLALKPARGYVGALVVAGHDWQAQCWQWA
jgi:4'-phosphopantetheinyl transferase